jgi:hypothetical protein
MTANEQTSRINKDELIFHPNEASKETRKPSINLN